MIVVSDTGPINYLVQLGLVHLLAEIYGKVLVPAAVFRELRAPQAPEIVRNWLVNPPSWFEIVENIANDPSYPAHLGSGEREAITLALRLDKADLLLDDYKATLEARRRGLEPFGILRVLKDCSRLGSLDLGAVLSRLVELGFYLDDTLRARLLQSP